MTALRRELRNRSAEVAHLKLHLKAGSSSLVANMTSNQCEPSLRGKIEGSPGVARLLLNVRAHIEPDGLLSVVARGVEEAAGHSIRVVTEDLRCFAPSRPHPTHRYEVVV